MFIHISHSYFWLVLYEFCNFKSNNIIFYTNELKHFYRYSLYSRVDDDTLGEDDEYEDTEDTYYAESTNTVQSVRVEDRQLSTLG